MMWYLDSKPGKEETSGAFSLGADRLHGTFVVLAAKPN